MNPYVLVELASNWAAEAAAVQDPHDMEADARSKALRECATNLCSIVQSLSKDAGAALEAQKLAEEIERQGGSAVA